MTTSVKLITADELWEMPDHGGRVELIRGELRAMAPTGFDHGNRANRLGWRLGQYVEKHKLGIVTIAETGFRLAKNPDSVVAPDIGFVSKKRTPPPERREKFFPGAPDLAVEVLSPTDTMVRVEEKVQDYLDAGTRLVWVLNAKLKTVTVHRKNGAVVVLKVGDVLEGEDVVRGFKCTVAEIFED